MNQTVSNTGILVEAQPLSNEEISVLEQTLPTPGTYIFYTDKHFKVYVLSANEPPYDFKDIAWHEFHRICQQELSDGTIKKIKTIFYPSKTAKYEIFDVLEEQPDMVTGNLTWVPFDTTSNRLDEALLNILKLG